MACHVGRCLLAWSSPWGRQLFSREFGCCHILCLCSFGTLYIRQPPLAQHSVSQCKRTTTLKLDSKQSLAVSLVIGSARNSPKSKTAARASHRPQPVRLQYRTRPSSRAHLRLCKSHRCSHGSEFHAYARQSARMACRARRPVPSSPKLAATFLLPPLSLRATSYSQLSSLIVNSLSRHGRTHACLQSR